MANKRIDKIQIDGELALRKIKEKHGNIECFADLIQMSSRSIRNYIKENAIPNKNELVMEFSKLMDETLNTDLYDAGFKAGYEKCLSDFGLSLTH